jgi:hypothetical protein
MAIAGRPAALLELSGPGVQALAARTPHQQLMSCGKIDSR